QLIGFKDRRVSFWRTRTLWIFTTGSSGFPFIFGEFLSIEILNATQACIYAVVRIPRNGGFSPFTFFCCDQHHAVGTPGAINSRSRSIFQYFHRRYNLRVEVRQASYNWNSIYYIKRSLSCVERTQPPSPHLWIRPGFTA